MVVYNMLRYYLRNIIKYKTLITFIKLRNFLINLCFTYPLKYKTNRLFK